MFSVHTISGVEISGQWVGPFSGASHGLGILSVEADAPSRAFLMVVQGQEFPPSRTDFDIAVEGTKVTGRSRGIQIFDQARGDLLLLARYRERYPEGQDFIEGIEVVGEVNDHVLEGQWTAPNGRQGKFRLENTAERHQLPPTEVMSWNDFKSFVADLIETGNDRYFRGQANSTWRLSTSLHRHGRYDLHRYEEDCLPELLHRVNAFLPDRYDFGGSNDLGAFLSLVQHHGFPTPLLDWTRSPYVAAFFAFESLHPDQDGGSCRLFAFDGREWMRDFRWRASFANPQPMLTVNEFPARNNSRHLPQQSVHSFTNVADAEWFIRALEKIRSKRYLTAIDIAHAERGRVMRELEYMGISAATMFPGLEGICRALRERCFLRRPPAVRK